MAYEQHHKQLLARADMLFSKRQPMMTLWQEIAENFYPERADFTVVRSIGDEFADHLANSSPILIRRDLGNSLSGMLRQPGTTWAHMTTDRPDEDLDNASKDWLQRKTKVMFRAMYDTIARFERATSEADHDFAAFGQAVISCEVNRSKSSLLYRTWHLRDVAWCETIDGSIGLRARKWKAPAFELHATFGNNIHKRVQEMIKSSNAKDAFREVDCRHIVVPSDEYSAATGKKYKFPFVSIWIDVEHQHVMSEQEYPTGYYIIPRWQTVSGTQYAHSPATVAALPDARLLQAITFTLQKAGEKAVDPPMIAAQEMIKSPIDIQPGGVTWVDADYDERYGEVLRPMTVDSRGLPTGLNMQDRVIAGLGSAFFLDKMRLPPMQPDTTAFEISQRLQEYVRQALPLFGPIEREYNAPLCEDTFTLLLLNNAFGPIQDIPQGLRGANVRFKFESPLVSANDQQKVQIYQTAVNLAGIGAQLDPTVAKLIKNPVALRDALEGANVPAAWLNDEETMEEIGQQMAQKQQAAEMAQQGQMMGEAGQAIGGAVQAISDAQNG